MAAAEKTKFGSVLNLDLAEWLNTQGQWQFREYSEDKESGASQRDIPTDI